MLKRPIHVEILPGLKVRVENYDGSDRWLKPGQSVHLPRPEARKLIRAGVARKVAASRG